jgi:ABC-type Fe3+-hydroxamate transport system substrate-binding protein
VIRTGSRLLLVVAWVALAGCQKETSVPSSATDSPPREVFGERIAVMAPAAMEILLELGALDRVVAIGDFVQWPPVIQELPRIGAYDAPNDSAPRPPRSSNRCSSLLG